MVAVSPKHRPAFLCALALISPFNPLGPKLWGQRCFLLHEMTVVCTAEPWCPAENLDATVVQTAAITLIERNTVSM